MQRDYTYEYEYDSRYCYHSSKVLKNKLNITDADELAEAERKITFLRTVEASQKGISGRFDFAHLKKIHKFLFFDIYEWAGKTRLVNISKGNQFCRVEFIDDQMREIFEKLRKENYLMGIDNKQQLSKRLAYYLGEINAIHPFRDGNATQRHQLKTAEQQQTTIYQTFKAFTNSHWKIEMPFLCPKSRRELFTA